MIALLSLLTALSAHASLETTFRESGDAAEKCARETPSQACYQLAADTMNFYIDSRPDRKKTYGNEERDFAAPRAWLTGHPTDKVYLLIHSYTMSPSELDGFAGALIPKGVNVISILLEGHGSRSSLGGGAFSLTEVSRNDWKNDLHFGIQLAHALGKKVVLVSYSLGGLLAILEGSKDQPWIDGFLAVAPPVAINDKLWGGLGACTLKPLLRSGLDEEIGNRIANTTWRKAYMAQYVDGACELLGLVTDFNHTGRSARVINNAFKFESTFAGEKAFTDIQRADFARLKVPYVLIASPHDNAVDYATLERLTRLSAVPGTLYTSDSPDHIHYGLARPDSPERDLFLKALEKLDEITGK
jgi:alpha-beta hydrolase superfamily lysophospholipase